MELPVDDNAATLSDYADVVVEAIGDLREDLVVRRRRGCQRFCVSA